MFILPADVVALYSLISYVVSGINMKHLGILIARDYLEVGTQVSPPPTLPPLNSPWSLKVVYILLQQVTIKAKENIPRTSSPKRISGYFSVDNRVPERRSKYSVQLGCDGSADVVTV